ncbi:hypothetical protein EJB05_02882, partial [Eragrostis curvula]
MVKTCAEAHSGQLSTCVGSGRGFGDFLGLHERLFSLSKYRRGRSSPGRSIAYCCMDGRDGDDKGGGHGGAVYLDEIPEDQ